MSYCKYTVSDKRSSNYERYYSSKNQVVNFLRHQCDSADRFRVEFRESGDDQPEHMCILIGPRGGIKIEK